jgi:hypothetical protein
MVPAPGRDTSVRSHTPAYAESTQTQVARVMGIEPKPSGVIFAVGPGTYRYHAQQRVIGV